MAPAAPVQYNPQIVPEYSFTNFALNATVATVSAVAVHFFTSALIVSVAVGGSAFLLMATVLVLSHRAHNLNEKLKEAQSQTKVDNHDKQQTIDTAAARIAEINTAVAAVFTAVTGNQPGEMTLEQQLEAVQRAASEQNAVLTALQTGISGNAKIEHHTGNPAVQAWNALVDRQSGDDGAKMQADLAALQAYVSGSAGTACAAMQSPQGQAVLATLTQRANDFVQLAQDVTAIKQFMDNAGEAVPETKTQLGRELLSVAQVLTQGLDRGINEAAELQKYQLAVQAIAGAILGRNIDELSSDGLPEEAARVLNHIKELMRADESESSDNDDDDDDDASTTGTRTPPVGGGGDTTNEFDESNV